MPVHRRRQPAIDARHALPCHRLTISRSPRRISPFFRRATPRHGPPPRRSASPILPMPDASPTKWPHCFPRPAYYHAGIEIWSARSGFDSGHMPSVDFGRAFDVAGRDILRVMRCCAAQKDVSLRPGRLASRVRAIAVYAVLLAYHHGEMHIPPTGRCHAVSGRADASAQRLADDYG